MEGPNNNCQQSMTKYDQILQDWICEHAEAMQGDLLGKKKPTKNARNKDFPI